MLPLYVFDDCLEIQVTFKVHRQVCGHVCLPARKIIAELHATSFTFF